ncbi:MAG: alpha/beta fold hydrolase [Candidatus Thorarchaeota archaeon]|nr:MAG: alpha/beta fold hydrolase [Candidatus Thorarchaeota archaeon]
MVLKRRYLVLILGLIVMLSGVSLAAGTQMGFGIVNVTEVDFQAVDGSLIHSTLQRPTYATNADPLPGVVVIHGSLQNKEWLMAFGIELARRGFVVLTIDANGHGNSEAGTGSGAAALDYIASLDYVDSTQIGLIGHSMGGGISWSAMEDSSVNVRALVLVGSGFSSAAPYTPNTLLATGNFDSLSSYPHNYTLLDSYFNVTGVVPNTTYGDFANNTARRAIFPSTNHLFETIDPVIVSESVDWMKNSLKGGVDDEHWIASTSLIYSLWLVGGLMGLLGALLTVFPMIVILLGTPLFADVKGTPSEEHAGETKTLVTNGTIYALIGAGTFFPFLLVGTLVSYIIPFPQYNGIPVMLWMSGSALVALLVLVLILRFKRKGQSDSPGLTMGGLLGFGEGKNYLTWIKTLILSLVIFAWLYILTLLADIGFIVDLRCFLPGLHDLTVWQAIIVPLYFVVFLLYFIVEGAWLTGPMLQKSSGTWFKSQMNITVKAVFIKTIPYLALVLFEFVGGYLAGAPLVPGMIGYSWLFFYAFTPWFAICTVITMFAYRVTGNRWLGAIVNALLCAWLLASILSFRG